MPYGPDDRALFESAATSLYADIVAAEGLAAGDQRIAPDGADHAAHALLVRLELIRLDEAHDRWLPHDPAASQAQVVAPMSQEAGRLLDESSQWARAFDTLHQSWRRSPLALDQGRGSFTYYRAMAIGPFLTDLIAGCEVELLTAQPQSDRDAASVAAAAVRDIAALERGLEMRTLYQHSARRSTYTQQYVAEVTKHGAEIRTLDEFFRRMIIVDRRVAVIPGNADHSAALAISEPAVVEFLLDVYERAWERARPFHTRDATSLKRIAADQQAMTVRMLIEGYSDPAAAKRLGVSPRTYAGYIADLKKEHDAATRFQLGYLMGETGAAGSDVTDQD